ncbi:HD-GYP domain-containing protein OS=Streptomyces tendae OX=1932 GN=GUR47_14745 PE=4 SV=1 [Streptomyces tendae]
MIELHPEYGHEMVRGIRFLGEARAAVLHHHERLDGSGYPYGRAGDRIPASARAVAVADAFDAMTSTRSYSRARPCRSGPGGAPALCRETVRPTDGAGAGPRPPPPRLPAVGDGGRSPGPRRRSGRGPYRGCAGQCRLGHAMR